MTSEYKDTIDNSAVIHDVDGDAKGQLNADEVRLAQMG